MGKIRRKIYIPTDKKTVLPFSTRNFHQTNKNNKAQKYETVLTKVSSTGCSRITKKKVKSHSQRKLSKINAKQRIPIISIKDAEVFNQVLKSASSKIQSKLVGDVDKDLSIGSGSPDNDGGSIWKKVKTKLRAKKDRKVVKKKAFQKKIELIQKAQNEQIAKSHREKTVIVRDLKPILDALDDIVTVQKPVSKVMVQKPVVKSSKKSMKKRQNDINQGLQHFAIASTKK